MQDFKLCKFRSYLSFDHLYEKKYPLPMYTLWQVWLKFAQRFWRTRISYFVNVFSPFGLNLPLKKKRGSSFEQYWIPITQRCFVPTLVCYWYSGSEEENFKILSMCFRFFLIISLWKMAWSLICSNLHHLHPRVLCDRLG